jgi:Asp/Glu/hydantoin racemase
MTDDVRRTSQPHDRLTRICAAMTDTFNAHPEHAPSDRCMVFITDRQRNGLVLEGYDDDTEAMVDLLMHLQAIFRANGKDLDIIAVPEDASGVTGG